MNRHTDERNRARRYSRVLVEASLAAARAGSPARRPAAAGARWLAALSALTYAACQPHLRAATMARVASP
jgi:hypothetical protein